MSKKLEFWDVGADDELDNLFADILSRKENESEAQREGSWSGRFANIRRGCEHHAVQVYKDYFSANPTYPGTCFKAAIV